MRHCASTAAQGLWLRGTYPPINQSYRCAVMCRGKYWTGLRSACEPMFHTSSLTSFAPLMNAAAQKLAQRCLTAPVVDEEDKRKNESKAGGTAEAVAAVNGNSGEQIPVCCVYGAAFALAMLSMRVLDTSV